MRKNSPRKWLHAIIDLLPVILIPVFMVYSHRHDVTQVTTVDIQYKFETNQANSVDELYEGNIYRLDYAIDTNELVDLSSEVEFHVYKGYVEYEFDNFMGGGVDVEQPQPIIFGLHNSQVFMRLGALDVYIDYFYLDNCYLTFYGDLSDFLTKNSFIAYNDFQMSEYNIIDSVEVDDTNSDIMSVFTNNLNHTVDTYFNMNEVFNLKDFWTWINTNIFSGTAPLIAKTIWNIIVYEFVIDLLFVFYSFFMFLIDFVDNLLEKPFNKGR